MRRSLPPRGLALLLVLAACHDDPAGPRRGGPAYLAIQPVFSSAVELASFRLIGDTVLTFGDSLRFHVTARDLAGAPVSLFYVLWGASDSTALRMTPSGLASAPGARATLWVRARTPTGVGDSTPVTVVPVPTLLSLVSGLAQSAIVGTLLTQPLRVRLTAADGLGVKGVPVRFRASGAAGGGVADSVAVGGTSRFAQPRG